MNIFQKFFFNFFSTMLIQKPDNNVYLESVVRMKYSLMVKGHVKKMCCCAR